MLNEYVDVFIRIRPSTTEIPENVEKLHACIKHTHFF